MTDWEIHGRAFTNCNCAYGCPCQFNALPTQGDCRAVVFTAIDRGRHGDTPLDGLNMAVAVSWPGPIHQGKGVMQPIIDERADDAQTDALMRILTGKDTDQAATHFWVFSAMCERIEKPIRTKITIDFDMDQRSARCEAKGIATGRGEPVKNPVTGAELRAGILLPNGFEYTRNEVGRGWSSSTGAVAMTLEDSHAHWCELHMTGRGLIKEGARM